MPLEVEVKLTRDQRPPLKLGEIGLSAKSVIAVGSGKGGVGKSTIAASIALGLARAGSRVGLMDADVYGPSIPHLLGVNRRPEIADNRIQPIETAGVKVISMGFLVPPGEAVVWRGPMLHGAITQFLRDTAWGDLDYLVIDMPPGTGDVALTLSQLLPLTGAVVVCTPQDVALLDAVKAISMFRQVNIPVLGMVENMSYFLCPDNGKRYDIFGHGGARRRAAELDIPFLGEVPIQKQIPVRGEQGQTAQNNDDRDTAPYLEAICQTLVMNLAASLRHRRGARCPACRSCKSGLLAGSKEHWQNSRRTGRLPTRRGKIAEHDFSGVFRPTCIDAVASDGYCAARSWLNIASPFRNRRPTVSPSMPASTLPLSPPPSLSLFRNWLLRSRAWIAIAIMRRAVCLAGFGLAAVGQRGNLDRRLFRHGGLGDFFRRRWHALVVDFVYRRAEKIDARRSRPVFDLPQSALRRHISHVAGGSAFSCRA